MNVPEIKTSLSYTYKGKTQTVLTHYLNDRGSGFDDLDIRTEIENCNPFVFPDGNPKVEKRGNEPDGRFSVLAYEDLEPIDSITVQLTHVLVAHNRAFALSEIKIDFTE